MYGVAPEVRKGGKLVIVIGRRHSHDIRRIVASRIEGGGVIVAGIIARRSDEQHIVGVGSVDLVKQRLGEASAAPAVRQHPYVCVNSEDLLSLDRELDGINRVGSGSTPTCVQELAAHNACHPIHAHYASAVIALSADGAGDMCAMIIVIQRITRVRNGVEAMRTGGAGDSPASDC